MIRIEVGSRCEPYSFSGSFCRDQPLGCCLVDGIGIRRRHLAVAVLGRLPAPAYRPAQKFRLITLIGEALARGSASSRLAAHHGRLLGCGRIGGNALRALPLNPLGTFGPLGTLAAFRPL